MIPIIDIFAGPGGLSEGFSAFEIAGEFPFKIALSIEKDTAAHKTLQLRSLYRQLSQNFEAGLPYYYQYLRREITREQLFNTPEIRQYIQQAESEALHAEQTTNVFLVRPTCHDTIR